MLRPSKHSHPDKTVISAALTLLGLLRSRRLVEFTTLQTILEKSIPGGNFLLIPALDFLFLLGLVEYHPKNDSLEYVGPNEA